MRSRATPLLVLAAVLLAALVLALGVGAARVPPADVVGALLGGGDATTRAIIRDLRLPRAILALLIGAGLGVAGAVFQALLRNPLAEPYVLGVSGGAAVGAVAVIAFAATAPAWLLPLAAFAGGVGTIALVFRIAASVGRALDTHVLLLAGVVVGAFFNAVILLLLTLADVETFRSAIFWMMGSLASATWSGVGLLAAYLVPALLALLALARPLNLMAVGEETALYLGTPVERVKRSAYVVASLLVAAGVAAAGVIGFVGLIVPHALRLLWGGDHRLLLPGSALAGGAFLLLADTAARTVAAPGELPVGVVTALIGVPVFVLLLTRRAT
ncbi:MAG TPA: iron ABC transporter permease [Longimicrobiales bacterium]|nr:iron ABC transporter permease [Longimicrobiales bacterium]